MKPLQTLKDLLKQVWDASLRFPLLYKIEKAKAFAFYLNLLLQGVKALQKNYPSGPVAGTLLYVKREIEGAIHYTNALLSSLSIYQKNPQGLASWIIRHFTEMRSLRISQVQMALQKSWVAIDKEINKSNPSPTLPSGGCGVRYSGSIKKRIFGGSSVSMITSWPWMAQIRDHDGVFLCGGTLIAPQCIITEADCFSEISSISGFTATVGSYYVEGSLSGVEGQIHRLKNQNSIEDIPIKRLILHPELRANIALVKLERPPDVNSGFVRPACLPNVSSWNPIQRNREHPLLGQECWITGWGSENQYAIRPATLLKQAAVPIVPSIKCVYYLNRFDLGPEEMVCSRTGRDRSGLCFIDAYGGSPLVCEHEGRWYLEGVLVEADCRNALYASVRWHFDWINSVMKYN